MPGRFDDPQSFLMVNKKKLRTAYLKLIKLNLCTATVLRFAPPQHRTEYRGLHFHARRNLCFY